jgi:hypothetical protein
MNRSGPTLPGVILKTVVAHTITYFVMGLLASTRFSGDRRATRSARTRSHAPPFRA